MQKHRTYIILSLTIAGLISISCFAAASAQTVFSFYYPAYVFPVFPFSILILDKSNEFYVSEVLIAAVEEAAREGHNLRMFTGVIGEVVISNRAYVDGDVADPFVRIALARE